MSRKNNVRLSAKEKANIILAEAKRNEEVYGEFAIQPTKLSLENGLSQPVLGQFLSKILNPALEAKGKRTVGILSRSLTQSQDSGLDDLIDELPDSVQDESVEEVVAQG